MNSAASIRAFACTVSPLLQAALATTSACREWARTTNQASSVRLRLRRTRLPFPVLAAGTRDAKSNGQAIRRSNLHAASGAGNSSPRQTAGSARQDKPSKPMPGRPSANTDAPRSHRPRTDISIPPKSARNPRSVSSQYRKKSASKPPICSSIVRRYSAADPLGKERFARLR